MTVSIIIPVYNHDRYVSIAVESALQQSWGGCEVVVVDDGSTDQSAAILARYSGIRTVRQENRGLAAARNAGLRASRGEIVIFLDADDRLWPDAVQNAVDSLTAHPDAAMVFGRCRLVDERGAPLLTNLPEVHGDYYDELLRDNYIWTPAMVAFRRCVFERVGTDNESISPTADYDIYLRIARQFPVACHRAVTVDYRQHGENMSRDPVLMLEATLHVLRAQRRYVGNHPGRVAQYREAVGRWRTLYGERLVDRFRAFLRAGDYRAAGQSAWHLLRLYPAGVHRHLLKKTRLLLGARTARGGDKATSDGAVDMSRP